MKLAILRSTACKLYTFFKVLYLPSTYPASFTPEINLKDFKKTDVQAPFQCAGFLFSRIARQTNSVACSNLSIIPLFFRHHHCPHPNPPLQKNTHTHFPELYELPDSKKQRTKFRRVTTRHKPRKDTWSSAMAAWTSTTLTAKSMKY